MPSKAEKKALRRRCASGENDNRGGHNKRENVVRYPSGRIDYNAIEKADSILETARRNRMRLPGVTKETATSKDAGTIVGRMCLMGEISERQYRAAKEYDKRRAAYLSAIAAPRRPRSGSDLGYLRERLSSENMPEADPFVAFSTDEDYAEWCDRAKAKFVEVRRVILTADPLGSMAMETIIVEDTMSARLVGAMRIACNRVADHLGY